MGNEAELLDEACAETGLGDFGDDSFREGLERVWWAFHEEAKLNELGQLAVRGVVLDLLKNRLQIEEWYRRHPEIDDEVIDAPLIGLGLPRTGSTALSFLLAEDPRARSLRLWESHTPCPPPSTVEGPDPRIAEAEAGVEMRKAVSPRAYALVPNTATGPMECQELMALDFKAQYFQALGCIPSYSSWILDADLTPTYQYEKRVLKLLQWGGPARPWRLKCPSHLLWMPALLEAFPDARFVMTHRDPVEVIPSVADVYLEICSMLSDEPDLDYIGAVNVEHWSEGMRRAIALRDSGEDHRFYDMDFRAVQRDPVGEVHGLYQWLGEPVTDEFDAGMTRWWTEFAATRPPNVHPDPATFGLDLDAIRPLFEDYTSRIPQWTAHSIIS